LAKSFELIKVCKSCARATHFYHEGIAPDTCGLGIPRVA